MNLLLCLSQIKDFRRKQGQRYPLEAVLLIIIMSVMSGRYGYREIASFAKANTQALLKHLRIKKKMLLSHVTIREIIMNINVDSLNDAFYKWTTSYISISKKEWLSVDGKAIRSTFAEYDKPYQNFVSVVISYKETGKLMGGFFVDAQNNRRKEVKMEKYDTEYTENARSCPERLKICKEKPR